MKTKSDRDPKLDRRVQRTQRELHEALISLIIERGWDHVSVQEICDRANVGRSTFYVHFADKEELLLSGFEKLYASMDAVRSSAKGKFAFADALLEHAQEHLRLFRAVVGKKSGQLVLLRFREVVVRLVDAELQSLKVREEERANMARYIGGGFVELLTTWLDRPSRGDSKLVTASFLRLTRGVLSVL
jgi:AcrR family transcriptional regulator